MASLSRWETFRLDNGSRLVVRSLKKLKPGEKVRIRASGSWWIGIESVWARFTAELPRTVELRAKYTLYDRPIESRYKSAVSDNSVAVELRR